MPTKGRPKVIKKADVIMPSVEEVVSEPVIEAAEETAGRPVVEEVPESSVPWTPAIGEKFALACFEEDYGSNSYLTPVPGGGMSFQVAAPAMLSYVATVESYEPFAVTIHEVVNGCVTTRPWEGDSFEGCAIGALTKAEAFQRIHS